MLVDGLKDHRHASLPNLPQHLKLSGKPADRGDIEKRRGGRAYNSLDLGIPLVINSEQGSNLSSKERFRYSGRGKTQSLPRPATVPG